MHVRLSAVLLLALTIATGSLAAQSHDQPLRKGSDVAFTYVATRGNIAGAGSFWMQGAGFQFHAPVWRGVGVVADLAGTHAASIQSTGAGLDLLTLSFGPRYTWSHSKVSMYGQVLAGAAFGFHSIFPSSQGVSSSAKGLAVLTGGGVNLALQHHLAVRLIEAGWLRTQLPNGTSNVQNDLRIGFGVVLRFR